MTGVPAGIRNSGRQQLASERTTYICLLAGSDATPIVGERVGAAVVGERVGAAVATARHVTTDHGGKRTMCDVHVRDVCCAMWDV